MNVRRHVMMGGLSLVLATAAAAIDMPNENLLVDPSFESGEPGKFSESWKIFGNGGPYDADARTGTRAAKIFGNFNEDDNYTGVFQEVPAKSGKQYEATIHIRSSSDDFVVEGNAAWVKIEFYDWKGNMLEAHESLDQFSADSNPDEYMMYSTGTVKAPKKTRIARFVYIFHQLDKTATGSTLGDDAVLKMITK